MQFNVEISELAERQYGDILSYIANQLENPQAVKNVIDDFDSTVNRLEKMAEKFGLCKSERLKALYQLKTLEKYDEEPFGVPFRINT